MNKFFKENKKLFLWCLAISIAIPIIILTPSPIGFIEYETGLTLVGYSGSIIGGFLTLYGVWWTIKEQKQDMKNEQKNRDDERKEDLAIQYKPCLCSPTPFSLNGDSLEIKQSGYSICDNSEPDNYVDTTTHEKSVSIKLKNIGRGEAIIKNIEITPFFSGTNDISVVKHSYKEEIFPNDSLDLMFDIIIYNYDKIINESANYDYVISITYTDFLHKKEYSKEININFITVSYTLLTDNAYLDEDVAQKDLMIYVK